MVQMDDQNKNLILATALSFLVILGWFVGGPMLFPQWFPEETAAQQATVPEASVSFQQVHSLVVSPAMCALSATLVVFIGEFPPAECCPN